MIHSLNFSGAASPGWPFETARYPAGGFCKLIIKVTIINPDGLSRIYIFLHV